SRSPPAAARSEGADRRRPPRAPRAPIAAGRRALRKRRGPAIARGPLWLAARRRAPAGSALDERLEPLGSARVAQLAQRLGLDLPDALAGDLEVLADLLEGVVGLLADTEPHAQHLLLARGQGGEHLAGLFGQVDRDDRVRRRGDALVLDEVAQLRVLLLTDGRLERDRLLGDLEHVA